MKKTLLFILTLFACCQLCRAQSRISGRVISAADQSALPGAAIKHKGSPAGVLADTAGRFSILIPAGESVLLVSYLGYQTREVTVDSGQSGELLIRLESLTGMLQTVVVSTGYEEVPRERSTGSFTHVDIQLLERSVSTDILSRLEAVSSGLAFNRRLSTAPGQKPEISVRGLSTMYANAAPLVVVDNFPYEGNIDNINPNDVESVTILKDASAASIWGARAGNGVIVITTKKGRYEQAARISLNMAGSVSGRPDLYYNPKFLDAAQFIGVEQSLFGQDFYTGEENSTDLPPLSPVVELLIAGRDGLMPAQAVNTRLEALKEQDIRDDAARYLYRPALSRQAALNISGGSAMLKYYMSAGYDKNDQHAVGNGYRRISLSSQNVLKPFEKMEVTLGINFLQSRSTMNGMGLGDIVSSFGKSVYPYARLADEQGRAMAVTRDYRQSYASGAVDAGLLDWQYRPLEELRLNDNRLAGSELRINTGIRYKFLESLSADLKYQYQQAAEDYRYLQSPLAYATRDLLNRYTQPDGSNPVPYGGILNETNSETGTHSGRGQLNFSKDWGDHSVSALSGLEIREGASQLNYSRVYGYDDEISASQLEIDYVNPYQTRPWGSFQVPAGISPAMSSKLDRFISWYGNGSYQFRQRYTVSGSLRRDASNLFGVNTNQKWVPLWSAGAGWELSREPFYKLGWLPYLKLRGSYGYSGNIEKSVTAFTTIRYGTDGTTGLPVATIQNPGNPDLRWERVGMVNFGLDFTSAGGRISGSVDFFRKKGVDLLGDTPLDPTTGFLSRYRVNYANMQTRGFDIRLQSLNVVKAFRWQTVLLFSHAQDKVTSFNSTGSAAAAYFAGFSLPAEGKSLYRIYSYPTPALDPQTGDPLVTVDGVPGRDYSTYMRNIPAAELVDNGMQIPPFFGSLRNDFSWKGFSLSANVSWKAGYYFRRSSIMYAALYNNWQGHRDFALRWQKPGDELLTHVPSMPLSANSSRDQLYARSASLVEKGDHVRLQDISLGYTPPFSIGKMKAGSLKLYVYASNLGLLWRASKQDLDPDYPNAEYLAPRTISFGINANL